MVAELRVLGEKTSPLNHQLDIIYACDAHTCTALSEKASSNPRMVVGFLNQIYNEKDRKFY